MHVLLNMLLSAMVVVMAAWVLALLFILRLLARRNLRAPMSNHVTRCTPADQLRFSVTQAHQDVLGALLRPDVILLPYQRQGVCKALDALRKAHGTLIGVADIRAKPQGGHP